MTGNCAFDFYLMESDEKLQYLIEAFKEKIEAGYDPNDCQEEIYSDFNIDIEKDLTNSDRRKLKKAVEKIYKLNN